MMGAWSSAGRISLTQKKLLIYESQYKAFSLFNLVFNSPNIYVSIYKIINYVVHVRYRFKKKHLSEIVKDFWLQTKEVIKDFWFT